jgi:hypothetical protein
MAVSTSSDGATAAAALDNPAGRQKRETMSTTTTKQKTKQFQVSRRTRKLAFSVKVHIFQQNAKEAASWKLREQVNQQDQRSIQILQIRLIVVNIISVLLKSHELLLKIADQCRKKSTLETA